MLKNILNLNGVQELNKNQQKAVNGGGLGVHPDSGCGECGVCKPYEECVPVFCGPFGQIDAIQEGTACKVVIGHK